MRILQMNHSRPILLVEDDTVDAMTVNRAVKQLDISNKVVTTTNGEEALDYLTNSDNPRPWFILLDLNMPKMGGIEFLETAKDKYLLDAVPVIVLTTSKAQADMFKTYKLGAAGYMVKPVDFHDFVETMKRIYQYWEYCKVPLEV